MKINDFKIATTSLISSLEVVAAATEKAFKSAKKDTSKAELKVLKDAMTAEATRLKYAQNLKREKLESCFAKMLENSAMMQDLTSDSYSLEKLYKIAEVSVFQRAATDYALDQALKYLVKKEFAHTAHNALRMNMMQAAVAKRHLCHVTDRQASMICKMFERLNVATRERKSDAADEKKATKFDISNSLVNSLMTAYKS
jgi:hypothetical protein